MPFFMPPGWPKRPATPKPEGPKQDRCPLCGSPGFKSFNMFKCSNWNCRNYSPTRPY